ncbi:RGT2-Sensor of high external glucose concentration [Fusarium pseudocircinatum]|uniref:RGT2-Sensor of high external glucose concentration n=1 Tax=Fusarium pseudocircinatum TaxID=56676 RepID=A0A8H5PBA3_9HYPO|nr:RGT2-Sensor of high external glucose concentration [Fusarium pseudocircinatum]
MPSLDAEMWAWASRRMLLGSFKRMLADDYLMAVTMITYTALLAIVSVLTRTPTNLINPDDHIVLTPEDIKLREYGSKLVLVTEHMQMITLWGVKGCLLFMYGRLTMSLKQNFLVKLVAGYVVVGFVVMQILWFAAWCRPFNHYWQVPPDDLNCSAETNHMITNAVVNISSDIMIILLPMPVFLQSQLPLKRKIILCGVFALGIFTILAATMSKIYSLGDPYGTEWSYWYIREVSTAVIAANLPLTWTLLQRVFRLGSFHAKYGKSSNQRTGEGTSRFRSAYGNLSSMDRRPKKTTFVEPGMSFSESQEEINGKDIPLKIYQKNEVIVNITTEEASSDKRSPSPPGHTGLTSNIQLRLLRISSFFARVIMDAQGSSSTREKCSPEAIPSTGLSVIYEPESDAPIVDIIFVHGLKGHPYKTWRCKHNPENAGEPPADSGKEAPKSNNWKRLELRRSLKAFLKSSSNNNRQDTSLTEFTCNNPPTTETGDLSVFWPADLLPQICNKARILAFGYDTKITKFTSGPTNTNSIFSHGKDFLFSLAREYVPRRPMIFVAHSLGGILVKEMLALSSTSDALAHKGIIESTAAIVFLGTPHRGSPELSAIGEWARSMLSSLKFQTTSTILDTLGLKTTDLERAHEAFCRLWYQYDFQVKTFQESLGLIGIDLGVLGNKVVPHESSLIGDPREHVETLQANHKQMSRFSSPQDPNFIKVAGEIKTFYTAIENAHTGKPLAAKMIEGNNSEFLHEEGVQEVLGHEVLEELLAALRFDGMNARREAISAPSTRNWLIQNPKFRLWAVPTGRNENLFFIKGKPGAGKSTLMKDIVRLTQNAQRRDRDFICADFFVDAGGKPLQRCSAGIFRSLLYQLLSQSKICSAVTPMNSERDTLISSIKDIVSSAFMPSKVLNETLVQNLLTQTLLYLGSLGTAVVIFVDALDELGVEMQRQQVGFWSTQQQFHQRLRICLSCREFPNITVNGCLELSLDACNQDDILTYISRRMHTRISRHEHSWRQKLTGKISSLSSGVFLWVVLVVDEVLRSYDDGASLPELLRLIEKTPPELEKLYEKILDFDAVSEDRLMIGRMFQWALAANRPLRLDEWHHILAFVQPSKPASLAKWRRSESFTENDYQLERKIKNLSRGLLEVSTKQQDVLAEKNDEISSIGGGVGSLDHEEGSARVVRVIHQSVYDFFIHKGGFKKLGLESVNPIADCHCTIANTCIDYLFIPELDEYFVARQRVDMASLLSASLCSEAPVETEEPPAVDPQRNTPGSTQGFEGFEGLKTLRPWQPFEVVEDWLARGTLASYPGTIADSAKNSVSRESLAAALSQVLDDYPALLVYAITEIMVHIDLAELDLNPTKETQNLIARLRDDDIWKRLRTLQQEKRARQRTTEWLEAVAQNRLPPRPKPSRMIQGTDDVDRYWDLEQILQSRLLLVDGLTLGGHSAMSDVVFGCPSSIMGVFTKFRFFNRRLALSCVLIAVSTFNYGFDNQAFATTQAMDAFDKQFGVWNEKTGTYILEPSWLSLFNSLNYIGFAAGVLIGTWISSRWGRRWCMFVMSLYALATATIAVTSFHREQIMAARILNYVYVGMELGVVPTFQSEIVPAQARGFMVGSYQLSLAVGGLVINSICFGTSSLPDNRAWRIPLGMFYIVPSIVVAGIWFVPESPRWLLRKNRVEEARRSLQQIREGAFTDEEIDAEFTELKVSLEQETEQGKFVELVRGINLKRTLIVMAVNFYQQAGGQAFVSQYGTIYVKSLGTINPFGFSLITSAISIVSITCILLWTDIVGRRVLMMASSVTMFAAMMTMGGLGIVTPVEDSRKKGVISMMAVFASGFGMGWAPLVYVVTTELSALRLRDLTSRVGFTTNVIMNFTVNFSIPYLIYDKYAGLNSKVGFIFGGIMATALMFVYFCVPECKGKTLEQVDFLFNQGVPIRQFGKVDAAEMMRATQEEDGLGKVHSDGKVNTVTGEERV